MAGQHFLLGLRKTKTPPCRAFIAACFLRDTAALVIIMMITDIITTILPIMSKLVTMIMLLIIGVISLLPRINFTVPWHL
jgi:hypothetical protein